MAGAPASAAATIPPWTYGGLGSCEHVVEAHTTYGADVADLVPAAYRGSWGSNDIADNAPGKPGYGGYGWRWCGKGDVAVECEKFCEALGDCVAISAGQCCFPYKARCASQLSDKSNSQSYKYYEMQRRWGSPFLVLLLGTTAAYVGGGVAWGSKAGAGGRGLGAHPHYRHWEAVHGLVMDGVAFARGGGGRRRQGGGQQATSAPEDGGGGRGQPHDRPRKKEKKERRPRAEKEKRAKLTKADGEPGGLGEPLAPEPPEAALAGAAQTTTAGGGGRWVHVPG